MTKERLHYIDVAKGVLILLLLMSHLGIALKWAGIDDNNPSFLPWQYPQPLFQVFFMQCFFIVSGYCMNLDVKASIFFKKLVKQLLIPWLFFEFVRVLYFAIFRGEYVSLFPGVEYTSLWFLNSLMFAKTICWLIHHFRKSVGIMILITLGLLLTAIALDEYQLGNNILCYRHGMIDSFFVAIGFALKTIYISFNKLLKYSCLIFLIVVAGRFLHFYELPVQDADIKVSLVTTPLFLITSISGSFACLWLCKKIAVNGVLEYFGRNSLIIYGMNIWFFVIILGVISSLFDLSSQWQTLTFVLCVYFCEIFIMWCVIELFNTKYLRYCIGKF